MQYMFLRIMAEPNFDLLESNRRQHFLLHPRYQLHSSPRPPTNTDTAEDKKTPDDSAPSPSSTPYVVPTLVTPLKDTRQVLASDRNPIEVPLPVLSFDLDMFSPTASPATDSYSPKPDTECEDYYPTPVNHLVRSQARQHLHAPPSPCQDRLGFCWWGEYPPTSKPHVARRQWRTLPADC